MLRQKTGPATIAANKTSASMPSWSCSLTRCSGEPVPAASATLRPKGCQVPSARPARRSRKLASNNGCPSIISASPPSGRWTVCGARSRYFSGTRCTHRSGGTSRCPSADIRLYSRAMLSSPSVILKQLLVICERSEAISRRKVTRSDRGVLRRCAPRNEAAHSLYLVLHQCTRGRAVFETVAAAGAFQFLHLVEVPRLQQASGGSPNSGQTSRQRPQELQIA